MKTAVVLRGHIRTWNYLKQHTIGLISKIYPDADWYVVFPESKAATAESIKEDLKDFNVAYINVVKDEECPIDVKYTFLGFKWDTFVTGYWKPAWYDYLALLAKREYELAHDIQYDNVLVIRPDVRYYISTTLEDYTTPMDPMAVGNMNFASYKDMLGWKTADFVWRAGSMAADIMSVRLFDTAFTDMSANQLIYFDEQGLPGYYQAKSLIDGSSTKGPFAQAVITPNVLDDIQAIDKKDYKHQADAIQPYKNNWNFLSATERIKLCTKYKIDLGDYQLELPPEPPLPAVTPQVVTRVRNYKNVRSVFDL